MRKEIICPDDCPHLTYRDARCSEFNVYLMRDRVEKVCEKCYQCRNRGGK